jgi:hypothetical protein
MLELILLALIAFALFIPIAEAIIERDWPSSTIGGSLTVVFLCGLLLALIL